MPLGDIYLSSNFDLRSQRPLDSRYIAVDLVERDALPTIKRYDGLPVYVQAESKEYRLVLGTVDLDLSNNNNWVESLVKSPLTPGLGLSGSVYDGTTPLTWNVNFSGSGAANTVSRSDHIHNISTLTDDIGIATVGNTTNISEFNNDIGYILGGGTTNISEFINNVGYIINETDPTVPSHVKSISTGDITNWNNAYAHSLITTGNPHNISLADIGGITTLTPGNGISGSAYNGTIARTWNLSYAGSGGTFGTSNNVARSDHSHGLYPTVTYSSTFTIPGSTGTNSIIMYELNTGEEIVVINFKAFWSGGISGTNGTTIASGVIPIAVRPSVNQVFLPYLLNLNSSMTVAVTTGGSLAKVGGVGDSYNVTSLYGTITYMR